MHIPRSCGVDVIDNSSEIQSQICEDGCNGYAFQALAGCILHGKTSALANHLRRLHTTVHCRTDFTLTQELT